MVEDFVGIAEPCLDLSFVASSNVVPTWCGRSLFLVIHTFVLAVVAVAGATAHVDSPTRT
jgi:hypothetical protein